MASAAFESPIKLAGRCLCGVLQEWADKEPDDHRACKGLPEPKRCRACRQYKLADLFQPQRRICKACQAARRRRRYLAHRDDERAQQRAYREPRRAELAAWQRTYHEAHRERVCREARKRYWRNRERILARMRAAYWAKRRKEAA